MDPHLRPVSSSAPLNIPTYRSHYYGDIVRRLFVAVGVTLTVTSPFVVALLPVSAFAVALIVVALILLAGLTNPLQRSIIVLDFGVSIIGLGAFVYFSIASYATVTLSVTHAVFFLTNHLLALVFAFALYYSSKSLRSVFFAESEYSEHLARKEG